jgi:hypothetical protein
MLTPLTILISIKCVLFYTNVNNNIIVQHFLEDKSVSRHAFAYVTHILITDVWVRTPELSSQLQYTRAAN